MPQKTFEVLANEFRFLFTQDDIDRADVISTGENSFHMVHNGRSVNIQLLEWNDASKELKLEVDGEPYTIVIKDELDQTLDKMGFNNVSTKQVKEVKAPMPGLVLDIAVQDGQELLEGDRILILEAMKMENSICIQSNAKVKKVVVAKGQAVDKNQVLVELE